MPTLVAQQQRARSSTRIEYALALCLLLWFACTSFPHAWRALNSDFPNYYITARLLHDHASTARIYEWIPFQRQKDHLGIGPQLVGMQALTPFSPLLMLPFSGLAPLAAKHAWLAFNALLLLASAWMLLRLTAIPRSRMLLLIAASYPLQTNLLNGQFYILLLFLFVFALWLYLRGHRFAAGAIIAVAIGLKLFPALFLLYFLRKRDWRAIAGVLAGGAAVAAASLAAFGWQLHRVYFLQILPRLTLGESTAPYNLTSASFALLFHRLFVFEPSLNPHPLLHAPWMLPLLLSLVQLLVLAPLILLIPPRTNDLARIRLEWAAVLLASLVLSPVPASYHFVLLLLPVAVLLESVMAEHSRPKLAAIVLLFLAIGFPYWPARSGDGLLPLLHVPRLYAVIALYALTLFQLRTPASSLRAGAANNKLWLAALASITIIGIVSGIRTQNSIDPTYPARLNLSTDALLLSQPHPTGDDIAFIAMDHNVYRAFDTATPPSPARYRDELTQTALYSRRWIERAATSSQIISTDAAQLPILDAESPIVSPDGRWLAFSRETRGRATLWLRSLDAFQLDAPITPPEFDVLDATFAPDGEIVFAALRDSGAPALFKRLPDGSILGLPAGEARYPAISPDGRFLAYSQMVHGSWNLRLRERATGHTEALTSGACNAIEPAWESDSRTLLYADDCQRGIGQTALDRRQVVR